MRNTKNAKNNSDSSSNSNSLYTVLNLKKLFCSKSLPLCGEDARSEDRVFKNRGIKTHLFFAGRMKYLSFSLSRSALFIFLLYLNPVYSQTYEEILRLRTEYEKLQKQNMESEEGIVKPMETDLPTKIIYKPGDIESFYKEQLNRLVTNIRDIEEISSYLDSSQSLKYFGYDFFTKRDTNQFWQNLPLPSDYQLGAGDELIISLWGEIERVDRLTINRDGSIFLDDVGIITLIGLKIKDAEKLIRSRFEKTYATLKGENSKSFINVSLGELKGLNVNFFGAVKNPGVHALHPFSTILTGLIQSGGIDTTGSLRRIIIYRNDKKLTEFDLYNILTKGQLGHDIRLLNQDIIFVTNRISNVSISGEIYRPGIFELKPGESLGSLIEFSGGLKSGAMSNVILKRIDGENSNRTINHYQVSLDQMNAFKMQDGDSLHISKLQEFEKNVTISGQVLNPGDYTLTQSMQLSDLLLMAGGFNDSIWWESVDFNNTSISRRTNSGIREIIKIDLKKMLEGDKENNPALKAFDQILIPKNQNFILDQSIIITGEVHTPGNYSIHNDSAAEIISRAGGFTPRAFQEGIKVFRDTLSMGWSHLDFPLINGDSLHVPIRTNTVKIVGAVNLEGYFPFKRGTSLKNYIEMAGGFTVYANRKDVVVILPSGIARRKKRYSSPKVLEGSTIIVSGNDLVVSQPDYLEMSMQIGSIIGSLATVALIVNTQK